MTGRSSVSSTCTRRTRWGPRSPSPCPGPHCALRTPTPTSVSRTPEPVPAHPKNLLNRDPDPELPRPPPTVILASSLLMKRHQHTPLPNSCSFRTPTSGSPHISGRTTHPRPPLVPPSGVGTRLPPEETRTEYRDHSGSTLTSGPRFTSSGEVTPSVGGRGVRRRNESLEGRGQYHRRVPGNTLLCPSRRTSPRPVPESRGPVWHGDLRTTF